MEFKAKLVKKYWPKIKRRFIKINKKEKCQFQSKLNKGRIIKSNIEKIINKK